MLLLRVTRSSSKRRYIRLSLVVAVSHPESAPCFWLPESRRPRTLLPLIGVETTFATLNCSYGRDYAKSAFIGSDDAAG
jgi:hypothetical protein